MEKTKPRTIPKELIPEEDRASFIEIAERARVESVNSYTVLCLGLHAYLSACRLARDV